MIGSRRDVQPLTLPHLRMFFMDFPTKSGISFPLPFQVSQTRPKLWRRMRPHLSVHTSNCCPLSGPTGTHWDRLGCESSIRSKPFPTGTCKSMQTILNFLVCEKYQFFPSMKYWLINRYTGTPYTYYWTIILPNKIQ